ncbi:MAG: hypothetical protein JXQ90_13935 [Cyclobacteriaceae bacterium]
MFKSKNLFSLDALGAMVSTVMLGLVLPRYIEYIGMPLSIVYMLALGACVLCIYSISCFLLNLKNWQPFMKIISMLNLLYCLVTFGLMIYLFDVLTWQGHVYFGGEIAIVVLLARYEWKVAAQ